VAVRRAGAAAGDAKSRRQPACSPRDQRRTAHHGHYSDPSASPIVWDNVPYVVDTGYGVSFKLAESKFPPPALRFTFITRHHSDHNAEWGMVRPA
jgi:hypothetical protein